MAFAILQKPGSKLGHCKAACKHRDCAQSRQDAAAQCPFCQMPIGYGVGYNRSSLSGELAHTFCLEEAVERNDARVGLF
jgi:hypothetical protein